MNGAVAARQTYAVPIALVDPPVLDARIDRDPEKLEELSRSILRHGLMQPIHVVATGERYETVDGERRRLAHISAGLTTIECFVYPTKELALESIKYGANAYRENMSAAEEAVYFDDLFRGECGQDIEAVARVTGKKVSYIDARLQLFNGDPLVFDAVKARGKPTQALALAQVLGLTVDVAAQGIPLGVAAELNKVDDAEYRRYYLKHAILGGSTVSVIAGWVQDYKARTSSLPRRPAPAEPSVGASVTPAHDPMRCHVCEKSDRRVPVQISVHHECLVAILNPLLRKGEPHDEQYETAQSDARRI